MLEMLSEFGCAQLYTLIDVEEQILFRVESHVFAGEEFESK